MNNFKKLVEDYDAAGRMLKASMALRISSLMRDAIKNEHTLDVLEDFGDGGKLEGVDFRKPEKGGGSFFIGGDDSNDAIVGACWDEEAGIAMLIRERDSEVFADVHPASDELDPSDTLQALTLLEGWMQQGL